MNVSKKKALQFIEIAAETFVPDNIVSDIDAKKLLSNISENKKDAENAKLNLDAARHNKKNNGIFSNFFNDRDEKIQSAQHDLTTISSKLMRDTSDLAVLNVAASVVLLDQQKILQEQQKVLEQQSLDIKKQNDEIFSQQKIIESQQHEINQANQSLIGAAEKSNEQALKLMGGLERISKVEQKIEDKNKELEDSIIIFTNDALKSSSAQLNEKINAYGQRYEDLQEKFLAHAAESMKRIEDVSQSLDGFQQNIETQIFEQNKLNKKEIIDFNKEHLVAEQKVTKKILEENAKSLNFLHSKIENLEESQKKKDKAYRWLLIFATGISLTSMAFYVANFIN